MAKILSIKAGEEPSTMWVKVELLGPQGELFIISREEMKRAEAIIRSQIMEEIREKILP